jgi:perosamine synthetase
VNDQHRISTLGQFPTWPQIGAEELTAVSAVLATSTLSQLSGPHVEQFEAVLGDYHGVEHCVALSSGTSAVHLGLVVLGIGPGDEVIVPSHTFVASASPVLYVGARPVFADVEPRHYCLDPADVERRLTARTRAVIAVHLNGHPAELELLQGICDRRGLWLIEDAAQAIGAQYMNRQVGSFGVLSCFSFWHDKIITTGGEGGAILTNDANLAERIRRLRHHGEEPTTRERLYHHTVLGYNYRMTSMQAAIGTVQLGRLDDYVAIRRLRARQLTDLLTDVPGIVVPDVAAHALPSWWKYVCRIDRSVLRTDADELSTALSAIGVPAARRYPIPLHRQPVFRGLPASTVDHPVADRLSEELFSLPIHPAITPEHVADMATAIRALAAERIR